MYPMRLSLNYVYSINRKLYLASKISWLSPKKQVGFIIFNIICKVSETLNQSWYINGSVKNFKKEDLSTVLQS
jgi:hypothetical protein